MNWIKNDTVSFNKEKAIKAKREYDRENKGRKTKMIKVEGSKPETYKEVFVD